MARIGYARVSTTHQDLETQFAKLKAEGCEVIRSEKVWGDASIVPDLADQWRMDWVLGQRQL